MVPAPERRRVLLVDDNVVICDLVALILRSEPIDLIGVHSGQEAIACARRSQFDLILLDIEMPEMSGFEVCRHFRTDPQLRGIPICFFSASGCARYFELAQQLGVKEWLTKPFHLEEFRSRIRHQLGLS